MSIDDILDIILYVSIGMILAGVTGFVFQVVMAVKGFFARKKWIKTVPYTRLVDETIRFTNDILYSKKIGHFPGYTIRYYRHKKFAGQFDGRVTVFLGSNPDIPSLVNTVLHEVMHYVQSKTDKQYRRYGEYTNVLGYWNNPFEIEARAFAAEHCEACLKYLESKQLITKTL